jgi:formylglycine-generating enzyme required for sulfatase activity
MSTAYPATVSDFRLDKFEITVARFRKFVSMYSQNMIPSGAGKNPNDASDPGWDTAWNGSLPADIPALQTALECNGAFQTWSAIPNSHERRPINCLDWFTANAFCIWDGGRLPTEAEWNYAASGGSEQRIYPWGAEAPGANTNLAVYGCYYNAAGCFSVNQIAPVGSVPAGNGRWGQSDLAGNMWEWTLDWFADPYPQTQCSNCANTSSGTYRSYRGGGFYYYASDLFSSHRAYNAPAGHNRDFGARCARNP